MAVKASQTITLDKSPDVQSITVYYKQVTSGSSAPAKPTTDNPSGWYTAEPTLDTSKDLYSTLKTKYTDGTFFYSDPQKFASYEAAKNAYNLADSKANPPRYDTFTSTTTTPPTIQPPNPPYKVDDIWYVTINTGSTPNVKTEHRTYKCNTTNPAESGSGNMSHWSEIASSANYTEFQQKADSIGLTASSAASIASIVAKINADGTSNAIINADHLNFTGKTFNLTTEQIALASTNFSVNAAGDLTCKGATMNDAIIEGGSLKLYDVGLDDPAISIYKNKRLKRLTANTQYYLNRIRLYTHNWTEDADADLPTSNITSETLFSFTHSYDTYTDIYTYNYSYEINNTTHIGKETITEVITGDHTGTRIVLEEYHGLDGFDYETQTLPTDIHIKEIRIEDTITCTSFTTNTACNYRLQQIWFEQEDDEDLTGKIFSTGVQFVLDNRDHSTEDLYGTYRQVALYANENYFNLSLSYLNNLNQPGAVYKRSSAYWMPQGLQWTVQDAETITDGMLFIPGAGILDIYPMKYGMAVSAQVMSAHFEVWIDNKNDGDNDVIFPIFQSAETYTSGESNMFERLKSSNYMQVQRQAGTTSTQGYTLLQLGNNIASGSDNNSRGCLRMFGSGAYWSNIWAGAATSNHQIYLPDHDGTLITATRLDSISSATSGNFTLKENYYNFDVIEVFFVYDDSSGAWQSSRMLTPRSNTSRAIELVGTTDNGTNLYHAVAKYTFSGTNVTKTYEHRWTIKTSGSPTRTANTSSIKIWRVIGYRYS